EFQKRGLPHSHCLLWIHELVRISREEDIDMYVSAELPLEDVDPECYKIVSEFMMHGPCGLVCPSASWTDRVVARISKNGTSVSEPGASTATYRPQVVIDEIKNYLDARYISPYEAFFREQDRLDSIVVDTHKKRTTLTEWLYYNERNTDERHLTYLDFPSEFVCVRNSAGVAVRAASSSVISHSLSFSNRPNASHATRQVG
nr:DNA helicase PIF1, ATP-dependent [Tanacetum cinerariifolium]